MFSPIGKKGATIRSPDYVGRLLSKTGKSAKIVVNRVDDKPIYASAHDLRRTFGDRWAQRVMPAVLKELMRHASIQTTMDYYVGRSAEQTAGILWDSVTTPGGQAGGQGNSPKTQKSKNT